MTPQQEFSKLGFVEETNKVFGDTYLIRHFSDGCYTTIANKEGSSPMDMDHPCEIKTFSPDNEPIEYIPCDSGWFALGMLEHHPEYVAVSQKEVVE